MCCCGALAGVRRVVKGVVVVLVVLILVLADAVGWNGFVIDDGVVVHIVVMDAIAWRLGLE